jgi:hypothetical protein
MRSVERSEVADIVASLVTDLEEIVEIESIPAPFKDVVHECIAEMRKELERVEEAAAAAAAAGPLLSPRSKAGSRVSLTGTATTRRTSRAGSARSMARSVSSRFGGSAMTGTGSHIDITVCVDPLSVKMWNRRLGILYYGCDLPVDCQETCREAVKAVLQKQACNNVVDRIVSQQCDSALERLDGKYKRLIESITNFLETQENYQVNCCNKIGDFFLQLAKFVEAHRKQQSDLDEKSADELWDMSEDFRLEREVRCVV